MPFVRVMVLAPRTTGDPADTQTNTLYFDSDANPAVDLANNAFGALSQMYTEMDGLFSSGVFADTWEMIAYDMEDPEPRIPIATETIDMTGMGASQATPLEVSMVVSFQATPVSGIRQSRRRGRIYLPTMQALNLQTSGGRVQWTSTAITTVITGVGFLSTQLSSGEEWAVFSPTTLLETGDLDASFNDVNNGWVDDEPDTQRRRGGAGGNRTTFSA